MIGTKAKGHGGNRDLSGETKTWESNNSTVAPFDRERVERVRRLEADEESRKASRELDELLGVIDARPKTDETRLSHNLEIDRRTANDLVMVRGFDPEYVAHRYGLIPRTGAAA